MVMSIIDLVQNVS